MSDPGLDSPGFRLEPLAAHVGPFPGAPFLRAWCRQFGAGVSPHILDSGEGLVALGTRDGVVEFLGEPDLTDYHTPLGRGAAPLLGEFLSGHDRPAAIRFDSLPLEAAREVEEGVRLAGLTMTPVPHQSAAVLELPNGADEWLASLRKKDRHEIRRKIRRFEADGGETRLVRESGPGAVATFAGLHRLAPGEKGGFMTTRMEAFFTDLERTAGAVVDVLLADGRPVAASFGFEDDATYYLYNSAYDPDAADLSPGIVLVVLLIRRAIRSGRHRFDFLKGDEMYKTRMGAEPRTLYRLEGRLERVP